MKTKLFSLLCVTILLVLSYSTARSAMYTWVGGTGSQSWTVATNWLPIGVPGAGDDAIFGAGAATTIDFPVGALSLNSIQITGRNVYFSPGAACALTLTGMGSFVTGAGAQLQFTTPSNLTVAAGATLTFSGNGTYFCNGNNTFINGTVNVNAGSQMNFIWGCVVTVGAGGTINNAGIINLDHSGTSNIGLVINGGGTVNNTGTISVGAEMAGFRGTLRIVDNGIFTGNTPVYGVGSHLEYTGAIPKTVGTEFPTGVNMNGLVVVQNTGGVTLGAGAIYSIAGGLTLNAPLVLNTNTILDFVGGSVCWGAPIQGNATASMRILGPITQACSCVSFSAPQELNQLVVNASGLSIGSNLTVNAALSIGAGGAQVAVSTCGGGQILTLRGGGSVAPANGLRIYPGRTLIIEGTSPLTGAGSVQYDAGSTLQYIGAGAMNTGIEIPAVMDGNVIFNKSSGFAFINTPRTINGTLTVQAQTLLLNANLTLAAASTIQNGATLTVSGVQLAGANNLTVQNGGILSMLDNTATCLGTPTYIGGSLLRYNGTGVINSGAEFPSPMNGNVDILKAAATDGVVLSANTTVNGGFSLSSGFINISGRTLNLSGPVAFGGAALMRGNGTAVLSVNPSAGGISGTLNFEGGFQTLQSLTMNRAGQNLAIGTNLTLTGNPALTLNNGNVVMAGGTTLWVNNNALGTVVGGSANSFVSLSTLTSTFRRDIQAGAATWNFPVGDVAVYRPLAFIAPSGNSSVSVQQGNAAGGTANLATILDPMQNPFWIVNPTVGFNARVQAGFAGVLATQKLGITSPIDAGAVYAGVGGANPDVHTAATPPYLTSNNPTTFNGANNNYIRIGTAFPTTYYHNSITDPTVASSWTSIPGGLGIVAPGFNAGYTFVIPNGVTATYTNDFTVPANVTVQVDNGGILLINGNFNLSSGGVGAAVTYMGTNALLQYINGVPGVYGPDLEFPNLMPGAVSVNRAAGTDFYLNQSKTVAGTASFLGGNARTNGFSHIYNGAFVVNGGTYIAQGANATTLNAASFMSGGRIQLTGALSPFRVNAPLNISAGVLELNGPMAAQVDPLSGNTVNFTTAAGTLEFTGGWAGTVNVQTLPPTMLGNMDIQNGNVQLAGNQTFNGNINISNGFLIAGFNLTLAGSGTITTVGLNRINAAALGSTVIVQRATIDGNWFNGNIARNLTLDANATLTNDLTVVDNLGFTSGVLTTSVGNELIAGQSLAITGANTTRFVNGPMQTTFPSGGMGMSRSLPVGKNATYLPVELRSVTTAVGMNPRVRVEAFDIAPVMGSYPLAPLGNEHWRVEVVANPGNYTQGQYAFGRSAIIPAGATIVGNSTVPSPPNYTNQFGTPTMVGVLNGLQTPIFPGLPPALFFALTGATPTAFYYQSGNADDPANWNSNIGGSGSQPANFSIAGAFFYVPNGRNATFTLPTTFSIGTILQAESGGAITVPNGQTLTANGSLRINAGGRLTLQGSGNVVAPSGVQYLSPTAVLEYNAPVSRLTNLTEFPDAMTAQVEIHSGSVRLNSSKHLQSTLLLNNSTLTFGAANRLRLSQSATFLGTSTRFACDSTDTLLIDGVGTLAGLITIPELARLTMNRSGLPLTINGTTRITQQLGLLAGTISIQANENIILQSSADTALLGGNSSSFVNGSLMRLVRPNLTPATAQPVFFPVGRNSTYLPLTLTEATTGTVAPYVSVEAQLGAAGGTPVLGVPGALSTSEFWRVVGVSGDFTGARVGVFRSGLTAMNSLAFSTARAGLYAGLGGTLTPLAQGTSLLGQPSNNVGERFYSIVGTLPSSPRITGFSPSIGGQGTVMTITGINLTGVNSIAVGGVPVQSFTRLSDSTIRVVLGPVASGPVQIGSPLGGAASDSVFTFVPMPVLTSVSPNPAGAGTLITIDGMFPGGVNGLIIGGVTIPQQDITLSQNSSLIVRIPLNATTSTIILSTPGGTLVSTNALSFVGAPRLVSFSPAVAATGAIITLTGENFVAGTTVRFGAVPAQSVTVNSPTRMSVVVPSQPTPIFLADVSKNSATLQSGWIQSVFLTVRTGGGTATSATQFVYSPTLNGGGIDSARLVVISRAMDTLVTLGGRVVITGENMELINDLTLRTSIGSTKASYSLSSSRQISVIIPTTGLLRSTNASLSRAPVTVDALGSNNRAIANNLFTVIGSPTMTAIVPSEANVGEEVRVSGVNLDLVTSASLGGMNTTFRLVNGELFVRVPADSRTGGALPVGGPLVLTSLGGIITTSAQIINAALASGAPFIAGFSPTSGGAGTQIIVTGANFTLITDASVGGIPVASFVINSSTRITITLAADIPAVSLGSITLLGPFGQVNSLGQIQFPISLAGEQNALIAALNAVGLDLSSVIVEQEDNRIVGLQIRPGQHINANLATFAEQLSVLTALKRLDLSNSGLMGAIPRVFARFTQLESLNLSGNALTGELLPGILCVYPNLRVLNLSRNRFEGEIPVCIALLSNVQELNLSDNRFQGSIPKEFGAMPNLAVFNLSNNRLSGGLPAEFGTPEGALPLVNSQKQAFAQTQNASSMRVFDASGNQLTGNIPAEWGGMRGLQVLNLSRNRLTGILPVSMVNWDALEMLILNDNRLEGIVPDLNVNRLQMLALQRNRFVGVLPQALSRAARLRVVLLENNGFERLPQFATPNRMDTMRVDTNRLEFGSLEGNLGVRVLSFANQDSIGRGGDTLLRAGSRFVLESGIGGASTQYQWLRNGVVIQGATASTLTFQRMQIFQSGAYICRATNTRFPGMTVVSRSVSLVVTGANSILSAPTLTFPPQNGENIAVRPRFLWSSVEGAEQYEIVVARDAALRDVVLRRTVSSSNAPNYRMTENDAALERGAQYFWRVRALALGSEGEMSLVQNFRVVPLGVDVAFSTVDVGRSLVGSGIEGEGVIVNVGTGDILLDSARVETSTVFFIVRSSLSRPLQPNEELPVQVRFTPNSGGEATANVRVWYKDGQQQPRQVAFTNALKGRGSALRLDAVEFEAVRVGRIALKAARIINVSNTPVLLRRLRVVREGNSDLGQESVAIFSMDGLSRDTLGAGDTLFTTIRCRSDREIDARARIEGLWEAGGRVDSAFTSLTARVRFVNPDNPFVVLGVRPKVNRVAPGTGVPLEVFIAEGNLEAISQVASGNIRVRVAFDRNVLVPTGLTRALRTTQRSTQALVEYSTQWNARRNGSVIGVFETRAVAGERDSTSLQIVGIEWGGQREERQEWERGVIIEEPQPGSFATLVSRAGGKRLIGVNQAGTVVLNAVQPNPATDKFQVRFTLAEESPAELVLVDVLGNVLKTLARYSSARGEYSVSADVAGIPSGTYFVVLKSASGAVSEQIQVRR